MKFPLNPFCAAGRSRATFPALLLLVQATSGCNEEDPRAEYVAPGSGGSGDGDGDSGSGGDPVSLGGEGGEGAGGSGTTGGSGGLPEGSLCEEVECHALAECDDSGGTAECICPEGLEGEECLDTNECLDQAACDPGTTCINTHGGFLCRCLDGQVSTGGGCTDILECDAEPCHADATCTEGVDSFSCSCDSGYFGNGFSCSDTDNCAGNPCGDDGTCITTPSGYVCQCEPGLTGASDCATACDTLNFADPALEAAVRLAINKPSGSIAQADIQNTIALYLAGENIGDLSGLECWNHLEILDLNDTPVGEMPDSLNALSELNRLQDLYLGCTAVEDLELLSEHPTLQRLSVARYESCQSGTVDLSALASISALRWLDISGLGLDSLSPVGGLNALEYLIASNNSITSVAPVGTLLNLKGLLLDGNQLSDITALSGLTLLEELDLSQNQISSMDSLTSLALLQTLSLGDNDLTSLSDLSAFDNLNFFDARNNQIDSLSGIASLGPMMWLGLAGNEISSLNAVVGTALSGSLSVQNNPIDCDVEADNLSTLASQGLNVISDCSN